MGQPTPQTDTTCPHCGKPGGELPAEVAQRVWTFGPEVLAALRCCRSCQLVFGGCTFSVGHSVASEGPQGPPQRGPRHIMRYDLHCRRPSGAIVHRCGRFDAPSGEIIMIMDHAAG